MTDMNRSTPRYRLLTRADTIQRGDEVLGDDAETWIKLSDTDRLFIGSLYRPEIFMPIRRCL